MSPEEIWQNCPVNLKNTALAIAREYNHGWAQSLAVPSAPYFWKHNDSIPSLGEIEEGTPEGPLGKGIVGPKISFEHDRYILRHETRTGRTFIEVSVDPEDDTDLFYGVIVSRPSGEIASGTRFGDGLFTSADWSVWGTRHEDAWKRAWKALGVSPPEFPAKILEKELVVDG